MPSLKQLTEFNASFRNIGNEPAVLSGQNISYQDLPLPDSEPTGPSPFDTPSAETAPAGADDFPVDLSREIPADSASSRDSAGSSPAAPDFNIMDDFGFNDLLNVPPEALPSPPEPSLEPPPEEDVEPQAGEKPEQAEENPEPGETPGGAVPEDADVPGEGGDEFAIPKDLLSGIGDDFAEDTSFGDFPAENFSPDIDFGGGDIFGEAEDAGADDETPKTAGDEDAFGELSGDGFAPEDLSPELDSAFEDASASPNAGEPGKDPFGADAFSGGEYPADSSGPSLSFDDDFTMPGGETGSVELKDAFDTFNPGDSSDIFDTGAGDQKQTEKDESLADIDDFSLPGIDEIFNKAAASVSPGVTETGKRTGAAPAAPKKLEDIKLTEEDLSRLQETLASYPLNLRLACEEIIAEKSTPADQMDALLKILIKRGSPKEAASLAGKILNRSVPIPKGFEKKTGEALEDEQTTFRYVFTRKFLPVLRISLAAALLAASLAYLSWQFIYIPIHSDSIYRRGYERIADGEYERANERFSEAFRLRRVKQWFYRYAEAFRDERQYLYAEEKYDELLRYYPRDKKGALDYANLETYYLRNYSKADRIIRTNILDYSVDDQEGLLALGDNNLAWGEVDPSRYENARQAYARLLERYGWQDPIVERMLLYFIRVDDLGQVIPLGQYFSGNPKKRISSPVLSELGGYLLDKQLEEVRGVPDANIERIEGVRDILIRASQSDPSLPEPRYHLARYYNRFGYTDEERQVLESAVRAFDAAVDESSRRTSYRIDAERRYAQVLTNAREFFPAEEHLIKGIGVYEDALSRRLLTGDPEYGRLYADLGDIEYFTKSRDMDRALDYYRRAEQNGWAPPEIQYRMGSAYYHLGRWENALERFFTASSELPLNRRLLHALGNVSYLRGNYFAAQGYYRRLLDLLETERARFPLLSPNERPDHMELAERLMIARNNMAVVLEALSDRSGDPRYRAEAMAFYSESARAWDALTRNPDTMSRSGGTNLGFLNSRNILYPRDGYEPRLFNQIDKDVLEPSAWETLAPPDYRLSD
jgi:tetratricopeptide (TPR) repeat protein